MRISDWSSDVCSSDLWQAHEGDGYDPATDVRGASPWMSANIVGGLWRAWLVTHDERIPVMLRDFSHYLDQHGFVPDELAGRWRSSCRSEAHTSELQSLMRISYAVFCLKKNKRQTQTHT